MAGRAGLRLFPGPWTMKEAVVQAHGRGLLLDPTRIGMPPAARRGATGGTRRSGRAPAVARGVEDLGRGHVPAGLARDVGPTPTGSGHPER